MKILVTGATGVIGSRLIPRLVAAGHDVTAAVRSPERASDLAGAGARPVHVDLFDKSAVALAVHGQDAIINLATHLPDSMTALFRPGAWPENDRLRREASAGLVDAGINDGVPRFIQESFALVYPGRGDEWIDETTELAPVRYNRTVADAEAAAERYTAAGGVGVVLRFGAFYGPDAFQIRDFAQALRYGWALLPSRPDAFISSISHDDAAAATASVLDVPAGTYNVVDDEPLSRRDYFNALAQALGLKEPHLLPGWTAVLFGSIGEMLARSLRISNRKLRHAANWAPQYPSVRRGFPAMIAEMQASNDMSRDKAA
ncbi:MAG TPA: NAD(P)-dependent oxidoreductase [Acetobacteraceae bacterium]|jgi:nucleoside-diphosphate-sugar epimerase|nr:NAD(P)-dependent oxidoreductase [Acetobacteraceae bacterium]